jgi:hypothetical protein
MSIHLGEPQEFTASLIQAARVASAPEFLDADGVEAHFGLKKSLLYRLLADNKIRAVSIRQRGTVRGKRLFDCSSIRRLLNASVDKEGNAK